MTKLTLKKQYKTYDRYKDSGVEWLGEVPEGWDNKRLGHDVFITTGKKDVNEGNPEGEYPFFTCSKDRTYSDNYSFNDEALLVAGNGEVGNTQYYNGKFEAYQRTYVLTGFKNDPFYLKYFISSFLPIEMKSRAIGSVIDYIKLGDLRHFNILTPPLPTQQSIASYLDEKTEKIDKIIENKKRLVELLTEKRKSVISEQVENINYQATKLKYFTKLISKGTTPSTIGKTTEIEGEIKFLKAENIKNNKISNDPKFFIDDETHRLLKRSQLQKNDILFVIAGATIGKTAIVKECFLPANTNQAVCFVRLSKKILPKFLWFLLQSNKIQKSLWIDTVQSAQPNLAMEDIGNFNIPLLDIEEQQKIVDYLDEQTTKVDNAIKKVDQSINLLTEYKSSLISHVVMGRMKV